MGSTLDLQWIGGLNTALDPSKIGSDELADMENANVRDGTIRLDQRYTAAVSSLTGVAQGSGWGKYQTGAQSHQYVTVVGQKLYQYDLTAATLTATPVIGGTGLATGNWWVQQFANYLYIANATGGLGRKLLAPGTNGTGNFAMIQVVSTPINAPTAQPYVPGGRPPLLCYVGASFAGSVNATVTLVTGSQQVKASSTVVGAVEVLITLATAQKFVWEYRDTCLVKCTVPASVDPHPNLWIIQGTSDIQAIPWFKEQAPNGFVNLYYRFQNIARGSRTLVQKLRFTYTKLTTGTSDVFIGEPEAGGVWLSLGTNAEPGDKKPAFKTLKYEYTHYNATTGFESAPSPVGSVQPSAQDFRGIWVDISTPATGESGVTHMRFYRRVDDGNTITRYRLAQVLNSSIVVWTDKLAADEITSLPVYKPGKLYNMGITSMCVWLNRMVVATGTQVAISRDGQPLQFEDILGAFDGSDPARGLTFWADDRQAEQVIGMVGLDALYMITDYSVRALIGNGPDNWRQLQLPGSEGAVGPRAWCAYKGGVLVLTPSGRLLYHHYAFAEPTEISIKLRARIGNLGMKAFASATSTVSLRPDGEIEVRNGTGRYVILSVEQTWRKGTHHDATQSTLFISGLPLRWLGTDGKLYEGGDDAYETDNGVEVEYYVDTFKFLLPRMALQSVFFGSSTEVLINDTGGPRIVYPRVDVITPTVTQTIVKLPGKKNAQGLATTNGESFQFRIYGNRDTVVPEMRINLNPLSPARHR